ncbi:hypothetical protein, partial [Rhizobium johnstonii]|uniref:hypothetical protein n=1 Tax=Rhizobium johnstonii TaxID=3019933 RepID=UPI003F9C8116
ASSHAGITNYIKDRNALDFISAHQRQYTHKQRLQSHISCHQTKPNQTKPNQTKPNQTKPNQTKPNKKLDVTRC